MVSPQNTDYREEIRARFLEAIRMILAARVQGIKTITQLAPMIGALQQNISQMENSAPGEGRFPTIEQVARLCKLFDYSADWIMCGRLPKEINNNELSGMVASHEDRISRIEKIIVKQVRKK